MIINLIIKLISFTIAFNPNLQIHKNILNDNIITYAAVKNVSTNGPFTHGLPPANGSNSDGLSIKSDSKTIIPNNIRKFVRNNYDYIYWGAIISIAVGVILLMPEFFNSYLYRDFKSALIRNYVKPNGKPK